MRKVSSKSKPSKRLKKETFDEDQEDENVEYEDIGDDEYDLEEDAIYHSGSSIDEPEEWEDFENLKLEDTGGEVKLVVDPTFQPIEEEKEPKSPREVWVGDSRQLKQDEVLDFENEAYELFYRSSVEWPCLSLDTVTGPSQSTQFPYTIYLVSGSQSSDHNNKVYVMKWSELYKTKNDDDEDSSLDGISSNDEEEGLEAKMEYAEFAHSGVVNRIRSNNNLGVVATWSDKGFVNIFNISESLDKIELGGALIKTDPILEASFRMGNEGYGLCWGYDGCLYSGGDCLFIYPYNGSTWVHSQTLTGHSSSIEDIQRSPIEQSVLATCSSDKTIKIWDLRAAYDDSQITINAHFSDVNVISWNTVETSQIASGSDDSSFKIWDLRFTDKQVACIKWHSDSITTIAWNPLESSELAVGSADDRITVWDLAVEAEGEKEVEPGFPPQLLFIHQGQEYVKEVLYHPSLNLIISTAANSFNVFRPSINVED
jgi:ribosome assembly protein RRB1